MPEKKITKKELKRQYRKLFDKAWKLWSEHRRESAADKDGMVICFSCGKRIPWRRPKDKKTKGDFANLGHLFHGKLDLHPMATQIQCTSCNHGLHGNLGLYAINLIIKYGLESVVELVKKASEFKDYTFEELDDIIIKLGGKSCLKSEMK